MCFIVQFKYLTAFGGTALAADFSTFVSISIVILFAASKQHQLSPVPSALFENANRR